MRYNPESIQGMVARAVPRTIVVDANDNRYIPYANNNGKRWNGNWNSIGNSFNSNGRIAVSGNWR